MPIATGCLHDTIPFWFRARWTRARRVPDLLRPDGRSSRQTNPSGSGRCSWMLATLSTRSSAGGWLPARHGLDFNRRERCFMTTAGCSSPDPGGTPLATPVCLLRGRPCAIGPGRVICFFLFFFYEFLSFSYEFTGRPADRLTRARTSSARLMTWKRARALCREAEPEVRPRSGWPSHVLLARAQEPDNRRPIALNLLLTRSSTGQIYEVAAGFHEARVPLVLRPSTEGQFWTTSNWPLSFLPGISVEVGCSSSGGAPPQKTANRAYRPSAPGSSTVVTS